jgi:phosphonate transport system substrate-binding protein
MRFIVIALLLVSLSAVSYASEITIGLIPEQNVFKQMQRYKPLGEYIEKKSGIKIQFTILSRYGNIINSFENEQMDGAFWGSFTGGLALNQLDVEPIARPLWMDGTSTYHGYIFVRKDSAITNVASMKGKTIAFVEKATTAGYIFPMAYLREKGVKDIDSYFKEYYFAGSHDATILALLDGEADIGCAKNTIYNILSDKDPRVKRDLIILARSPVVPSNGLMIRKDLDRSIKEKLTDALLGMHKDDDGKKTLKEFGAIKFIMTTREDYKPVFDVARKAGIDLKEYQYINK